MLIRLFWILSTISVVLSVTTTSRPIVTTNSPSGPVDLYVSSNNNTKDACTLMQLSASISVTYVERKDKPVSGGLDASKFGSTKVLTKGSCEPNASSMIISWPAINKSSVNWELSFSLKRTTDSEFQIIDPTLRIVPDALSFPGVLDNATWNLKGDSISKTFSTKGYYFCKNSLKYEFSNKPNVTASFTISQFKFQSFRTEQNDDFYGISNECAIDALERNIIPLIVGGVLAAMIVVVIITYLIGRHRHKANYQTI